MNRSTLTEEQAAEYLHLHPNTVQARAKRGMIPGASKPGKRWVFPEEGLRQYRDSFSPCPYTESSRSGTSISPRTGAGLEGVLGLPIRDRRRLITRG